MNRPVIRDRTRTLFTHRTAGVPATRFCGKDTDNFADGKLGMHVKPIQACRIGFDAEPAAALRRCLMVAICATATGLPGTIAAEMSGSDFFQRLKQSVVEVHSLEKGSGVIVDVDKVVTNCHVVADTKRTELEQEVIAYPKTYPLKTTLAARDDDHDLCLLSIEESTLFPEEMKAPLGRSSVPVGGRVYAVGAPKREINEGSVKKRLEYRGFDTDSIPVEICSYSDRSAAWFILTDADIDPGSSGGGLFNQKGELIGITRFGYENPGFTVPVEYVKKLLDVKPEKALHEVAKKVVEQGNFSDAIWIAKRIDVPNQRAKALLHIAEAQIRAEYATKAKRTLDNAIQAVDQENDLDKSTGILRRIVQSLARIGSVPSAIQTAERIADPAQRSRALSYVAKKQAEEENFAGAMNTANMITLPSRRTKSLDTVRKIQASALAKKGNFPKAIRIAGEIKDLMVRAYTFNRVAKAQARTGDVRARATFSHAARAANKIGSLVERADALREITETRIEAGHVAGTLETFRDAISAAEQIADPTERSKGFRDIVDVLSDIGDFIGARQLVKSIDDQNERAMALRGIAKALADAKNYTGAEKIAKSIRDPSERDMALHEIVRVLADAEKYTGAKKIAGSIRDPSERDMALHEIVKVLADAEKYTGAKKIAESINDHGERAGAPALHRRNGSRSSWI